MITFGKVFLVQIFFLLLLCSSAAQNINTLSKEDNGKEILLGKIDIAGLQTHSFAGWFNPQFNSYTPDEAVIGPLKKRINKYDIKIFLGTWCGDSKREIPRFYKILKELDFPMNQVETVALDHRGDMYKKSPTGEEQGLRIIKVPTFIFIKKGKEVNRIVESPLESLEKDMLRIVKRKGYVPNYSGD